MYNWTPDQLKRSWSIIRSRWKFNMSIFPLAHERSMFCHFAYGCVYFPHFNFKYIFFLLKILIVFLLSSNFFFFFFLQKVKKFTLDETNSSEAATIVKEKQWIHLAFNCWKLIKFWFFFGKTLYDTENWNIFVIPWILLWAKENCEESVKVSSLTFR